MYIEKLIISFSKVKVMPIKVWYLQVLETYITFIIKHFPFYNSVIAASIKEGKVS